MCATGTPSWTLTVKNHRASVHALCRDSQQSSALRGRGPRRSRVAVRGLEPPRPLSLRVVAYPHSSTKVTADAAAPIKAHMAKEKAHVARGADGLGTTH